jgi:hypothetical protein
LRNPFGRKDFKGDFGRRQDFVLVFGELLRKEKAALRRTFQGHLLAGDQT